MLLLVEGFVSLLISAVHRNCGSPNFSWQAISISIHIDSICGRVGKTASQIGKLKLPP